MKNLIFKYFRSVNFRNWHKLLFAGIVLIFLNSTVMASLLEVSADITSNTTWSYDTMLVTADITVQSGVTLTIVSGTKVIVDGHYSISVQGIINALGTENDPIIFTVGDTTMFADTDTSKGGWHGLRFDVTNADTSFLNYCIIEYTKAISKTVLIENSGGAIYSANSTHLSLSHCTIRNNYAAQYGAGLYLGINSVAMIDNCIILYNIVGQSGAGLYHTDNAFLYLSNSLITNNYAPYGAGGGISSESVAGGVLINNVITNNSAQFGGGILFSSNNITILRNNTIVYNSANDGGGIFSTSDGNPVFTNCIIGGNSANDSGDQIYIGAVNSSPDFYYCDIQDGSLADHDFGFGGGVTFEGQYENCLDDDPVFRKPPEGPSILYDGLSTDYSIAFNSACRDAGKPDYTEDSVGVEDFAGDPRFMYGQIDIGAHEYQYGYFGEINDGLHGWCTEDTIRITGDLAVGDTTLLAICPGTVVFFEGKYKLTVKGQIYAPGEEDNWIKFTAADTSIGWGGLRFIDLNSHTDSSYMENCEFEYGKATGTPPDNRGGAVYFDNSSNVFLIHSRFLNCSAETSGGAIAIYNDSKPTIVNCLIGLDRASNGGGIAVYNSKPLLFGNVIAQNEATSNGAGIWIWMDNGAAPTISNNAIADNYGTGIYSNNSAYQMGNTIVWGNTQSIVKQGDSIPVILYSNIEGGYVEPGAGPGIIDVDPLFIGEDYDMDYYNIHPTSPMINKGNPEFELTDLRDILGNDRVIFDTIDIGPYEYDGSWYGHISNALELCDDTIEVSNDIYIDSGAVVTICPGTVVQFQGHYGIGIQGQIIAEGTSDGRIEFTVSDTTGLSNMDDDDGSWFGIVFDNPEETADTSKFDYCDFRYAKHETSSDIDYGSAFYISNTDKLTISNSIFENNICGGMLGGAIYGLESKITLSKNIFQYNTSFTHGGAIFLGGDASSVLLNTFTSNKTLNGDGGAIYISYSTSYLEGNLMFDNSSALAGSAIYGYGYDGKIVNNTIIENTASSVTGCGIEFNRFCDAEVINSIIWGNIPYQIGIAAPTNYPNISYCNIEGDTLDFQGWAVYDHSLYTMCKNSDPLFTDAANHIYTLTYYSPCVDSGFILTMKSPVDINGNDRIEINIDMGAFEYHNAPPTALSFTGTSVDENVAIGTFIGIFDVTDVNLEDIYGFYLEAGSGDDNNGWFRLSNDSLYTIREIDYETTSSLSFRAMAYDIRRVGNNIAESFTITVNDVNEDGIGQKNVKALVVNIYPNPVSDYVTITASANKMIQAVEILGIDGKLLYSNGKINSNRCLVNTSSLENGLYLIKISVDGICTEKTFIKSDR